MHRSLVERVNAGADRVIVVAILYLNHSFFQRLDITALLVRDLQPGMISLSLRESYQNRIGFAPCFNDLPLAEIFFREVERLEQHVLDLFVGEAIAGLDVDFSLLPTALLDRKSTRLNSSH